MDMGGFSKQQIRTLLDDELFIQWLFHPTYELNKLWEQRMNKDKEVRNNIITLKNIIKNLRVKEPEISQSEKDLIWNKIERRIDRNKKNKYHSIILWATSLAASIIIAIGGYFFFWGSNEIKNEIDYSIYAESSDDEKMKTGNINLLLSDNKRIDIEKDSIVIAYDAQGSVNIDSEKVAEAAPPAKVIAPELNQLIVPYGKTTSLILSDGTKIWVNSGSKLVYPAVFDKKKREIYLTGEAFLDVAKSENVPFIVKTNDVELNVLGTSFNVSAYSDDIAQSVVLVSGSVEVKSKEMKGTYKIEPSQMFSYDKNVQKVNIEKVDVIYYTSWVSGYINSSKESLDNLFQKLGRHFNVTFAYNKDDFKRETFSGKLDLRVPLEGILENISIATNNKLKYKITDEIIQLTLSYN